MEFEKRKIVVYNKNKKKIAEFSNEAPISKSAMKNMMVNPTVTLVSNGESTLSFEMLADSPKWQMIKDPENIYECGGREYTALKKQSIAYNGKRVVVNLVETWYLLKTVFIQAHNTDTKIEALDEHTVKILPKTKPEFKLTINGKAYEDSEVKDSRGVLMPRGSAGYALWAMLKDTDWKIGICDVLDEKFDASKDFGTANVESDMKSVLDNIQLIQQLYGGILVWDSKNKTCSLRDENKASDFNKWKGVEFRKDKNLSESPRITWDNDIVTRLYPLGNGNLNIKKVNDGKNYVENFSYTKDVYTAYAQNPRIFDTNDEGGQKTLKAWAERELKKLCRPRKNIEYSVVDMRANPKLSHEQFDVNDIVKAYYIDDTTGKEVSEELRIQSISYDYFHPSSNSTLGVGDKIANEQELFYQIYKFTDNAVPTNPNGYISGLDVEIKIPDDWLEEFFKQFESENLTDYLSFQSMKQAEVDGGLVKSIASLQAYADETFATIESFLSYKKEIGNTIIQSETGIKEYVDENYATIDSFTSFQKSVGDRISAAETSIVQSSSALDAQITLEAKHYTNTTKNIASIQIQVNNQGSAIYLKADKTYVDNLIADTATISYVNSRVVQASNAIIHDLDVTNGNVEQLRSSLIKTNELVATKVSASEVDTKLLKASSIGTQGFGLTIGNASYQGYATAVYGDLKCNGTVYGRLESANGSSETVYIIGKNDNYEIYFNRGIFTGWNKA